MTSASQTLFVLLMQSEDTHGFSKRNAPNLFEIAPRIDFTYGLMTAEHDGVLAFTAEHDDALTFAAEHDDVLTWAAEHNDVLAWKAEHDHVLSLTAEHDDVSTLKNGT